MNLKENDVIFLSNVNSDVTGYEEYHEHFYNLQKEYLIADDKRKDEIIEEIVNIYYDKKIFPNKYYCIDSLKTELLQLREKNIPIVNYKLTTNINTGNKTCKTFCNNIHKGKSKTKNLSELSSFCNRKIFKKTVKFKLKHGQCHSPNAIRGGFALAGGSVQNFLPSRAKAIYDHFCKDGDVIYDFSAGFGGRMLGAMASKHNVKYIGIEPNTETFDNLQRLGDFICNTYNKNFGDHVKLYKDVSEDFILPANTVDLAFSSPPYFDIERYTDEPTQCYNRFPQYDSWINGYVYPTMENIKNCLKVGGKVLINIADNKKYKLYSDWKTICEDIGLKYIGTIEMYINKRPTNKINLEGILIFEKV